jgi:hypothetical protein
MRRHVGVRINGFSDPWPSGRMKDVTVLLNAALPLLSVLIGSAITYFLNVRTRQRSKVEDVLHEAIAAVAVADASQHYITSTGTWQGATPADYEDFRSQLGRQANEAHVRAVAEARAALARASAYAPELREYYQSNTDAVYKRAEEITEALRKRLA